ncbi:hypothetical protein FHS78_001683 [Parvibaculum indicum]|uniref:M14 family metallopeptidase n=1 Tax=Parvibaculum indicum TaxID=562969 RepID=UPI0014230492|nr:M14 family metallopeptidase [Parvibaculum indicum]NIJ41396.1 hypothetical protein [Parvibaculum indicum]
MTKIPACFSETYAEAREKFIAAAKAKGAAVDSHEHPLKGPGGETLAMDVAYIGPADADAAIALGAGTHGVEGYCGSGLQTALLETGFADRLPEGAALVLIHAINPFGFAWSRRVNEDNVDLNRNFVDHDAPYPENPGYEELIDVINLPDLDPDTIKSAQEKLLAYADKNGFPALQHAMSAGQYAHPGGVQFGGNAPSWSQRTLREVVRKYLAPASRIVFIDFHSGLGPRGHGEIISTAAPGTPTYDRMTALWGDEVISTKGEGSVSSNIAGSITDFLAEELDGKTLAACGLEFGTLPITDVSFALQADNWLWQHGGAENPRAKEVATLIRNAFYVNEDDWKEEIFARAEEVAVKGLKGLE